MSVIEFIILAIALSFEPLLTLQACASWRKIALTKGLAESAVIALINVALLVLGWWLGSLLHYGDYAGQGGNVEQLLSDTDAMVYLGLMILVAVRMMLRGGKRRRETAAYDIGHFGTAVLLGVALGTGTLLVGLAMGFHAPLADNVWRAVIPLLVVMTLMSLYGIMLGRQDKEAHPRQHMLIAALLVLAFALKGALWG